MRPSKILKMEVVPYGLGRDEQAPSYFLDSGGRRSGGMQIPVDVRNIVAIFCSGSQLMCKLRCTSLCRGRSVHQKRVFQARIADWRRCLFLHSIVLRYCYVTLFVGTSVYVLKTTVNSSNCSCCFLNLIISQYSNCDAWA